MRTSLIVVLSLVAGAALGGAAPFWQRWWVAGGGVPELDVAAATKGKTAKTRIGPQPVADVDSDEFRFGTIAFGATRTHLFTITNRGDALLELRKGSTSCKCTISELKKGSIAPGESAQVKLAWTAKLMEGNFREIATILTNDPRRSRIELSVTGRVTRTLQIEPHDFVFSKVNIDEEKTARVRLLCFGEDPVKITDTKLVMRSKDNDKFFDISIKPIPRDALGNPDANSGFDVSLTIKPGIPVGTFRGRLELTTNVKRQGAFYLPIRGSVASDLSVVGKGWSSGDGILALGTIHGRQGFKRPLFIYLRGRHPEQIDLGPIETDPDCLHVTLGKKKSLLDGRVVSVPLTLEIPAGTRSINRLGTAQAPFEEIVVHTNDPKSRELRMLVRFAVEP